MKKSQIIFICFFCFIFVYVLLKGYFLSFTHDESISYQIIKGNSGWYYDPNNHLLNSFFMFLFGNLFGYSELSLRMPNILSFILFFVAVILIIRTLKDSTFIFFGIVIIVLNPFLTDFFSLARGYGMGIALFTLGLYFSICVFRKEKMLFYIYLSSFCFIASVISNYNFLNGYAGVFIGMFIILITSEKIKELKKSKFLLLCFPLLLINTFFLLFVAKMLFGFKTRSLLYIGGKKGLWSDTLFSLTNYWTYDKLPSILVYSITLLCVIWLLICLALNFKKNMYSYEIKLLSLAIVFSLFLTKFNHYIFDINYPTGRMALFYYVLFGLLSAFSFFVLSSSYPCLKNILFVCMVFIFIHFIYSASLNRTIEDQMTFQSKNIIRTLISDISRSYPTSQKIELGIYWHFEPIVNYYREYYGITQLEYVTREGVYTKPFDYYYTYKSDIDSLAKQGIKLISITPYDSYHICLAKKIYK